MKNLVKVTVASLGFLVAMSSCTDDQKAVKRPLPNPVKEAVTQSRKEPIPLDSLNNEELPELEESFPGNADDRDIINSGNTTESTPQQPDSIDSETLLPTQTPIPELREYPKEAKPTTRLANILEVPDMGIKRRDYTPSVEIGIENSAKNILPAESDRE